MFKILSLFIILLPFNCLAQSTISGRVFNHADKTALSNANVFLSNATIGDKTAEDGTFTLRNAQPGKYDLVVSVVGFEAYTQTILVGNGNIKIPDIALVPKSIALKEVNIKPVSDPNRQRNLDWFQEEFLGITELSRECTILNPDVIDLDYDEEKGILTGSSYDFIEIENDALGYKIKYLLKNFVLDNKDRDAKKIYFGGSVLFEDMKGTPGQLRRWQNQRQEVYEGSLMHFLRSGINKRMEKEGFRVLRIAAFPNPKRPADTLINAKIELFKKSGQDDSLSFWMKKSKLPKTIRQILPDPVKQAEIINTTDQPGIYEFNSNGDPLNISYNKEHHFHINNNPYYLNGSTNKETSYVVFNQPSVLFDHNGSLINPGAISLTGIWLKYRLGGLLPINYVDQEAQKVNSDSTAAEKVVARLKSFSEQHVTEKAYLHFDKPYYAAGDTMYFKSYVTLGEDHHLSDLSGVLHVDLINETNKIDQSIKLQLIDGVAWGDFALPDSLPKGNYQIRAYTNWMQNEGDAAYFNQTIPVGSILNNKIPESSMAHKSSTIAKPDIQFFPEGGSLIVGIRSKIAFKAIGPNGLGINVKGVIIDNEGKEIASFASSHLGMGDFYFNPAENKTYTAKLTYPDGTENPVTLPIASTTGIVLSVNNDSLSTASVRIEASKAYYQENKGKDYLLLIYSGGKATSVTCALDSQVTVVDLLKRRLHTGITTVTLFSPTGEPLGERLLFIQNYDQLSFAVNTDKAVYAKREKVNIGLNVRNRADEPSSGHFSVSVTDENLVPVDENAAHTILTDLLLTSDLKGEVEQPNYYFTKINDTTQANLDLVMLTHGYRRFEWQKILNNAYAPLDYQPEKSLEINGIAKSLSGKPLVKGTVSLIPPSGGLLTQVTDDNGRFRFSNLVFMDTTKFVLQAVNSTAGSNTKLVYNNDQEAPYVILPTPVGNNNVTQIMSAYLENNEILRKQLNLPVNGKRKALKEVQIRGIRSDDRYRTQSLAGPGNADQVMHAQEIEMVGGQLSTGLNGRLRGIVFLNGIPYLLSGASRAAMLVVVDGSVMYPSPGKAGYDVDNINLSDVETVEVLKYNATAAIYGVQAGHGVLIITTKLATGKQNKDIPSTGILPITVMGYYKAREFYSPRYQSPPEASNRRDLRSTIFWKPELVTDKDGKASLDFYNADGTGTYRVVIEGIDENGHIGRQVYRYKVQ